MSTSLTQSDPTGLATRAPNRRHFLESLLLVLGTISCSRGKALLPAEAEVDGERICVSLRVLQSLAEKHHQVGGPEPEEVLSVAGMNWPEAFVCDPSGHDVILLGAKVPERSPLHLDDLTVNLRNVWGRSQAPFCSLDPRK